MPLAAQQRAAAPGDTLIARLTRFIAGPTIRARLTRNTLWSLAGSVMWQGSSLLSAIMVARMLGVTRFGQLALIQATVLMAGTLGEMGLALTSTKFVSRWRTTDPQRAGTLIGWTLQTTVMSGIVLGIALGSIGPRVPISGLAGLGPELWTGCILLIFEMLNRVQLGALAGLEAFTSSAIIQASRGILMLPTVWLGAHYGGLQGALASMAVVSLVAFAVGHVVLRSAARRFNIALQYGAPLQTHVLATSASLWTGTLLLTGTAWLASVLLTRQPSGLTEVAVFYAADRWKALLLFLPQTLFQVVLPMLSSFHAAADLPSCRRIFTAALGATVAVTGLGAIAVSAMSTLLMSSYGSDFTPGASVLVLSATLAVVTSMYTVGSSALWALGRPSQMVLLDAGRTGLLLMLLFSGFAVNARSVVLAYLLTAVVGATAVLLVVRRQLSERKEGFERAAASY
jgi:O-antigen/teichoic acid export membrane protein